MEFVVGLCNNLMDPTSIGLGVCTLLLLIYWFIQSKANRGSYPPGPFKLPIFGNLLSFGKTPHIVFDAWGKKYGGIVGIKLASTPAIVITDPVLIQKALNKLEFNGRPTFTPFHVLAGGVRGVATNIGEHWVEQRSFTESHLTNASVIGSNSIEFVILTETKYILEWLQSQVGAGAINLQKKLVVATLNAYWKLVAGQRYQIDDPKLENMFKVAVKTNESLHGNLCINYFPRIAALFSYISGWKQLNDNISTLINMYREAVEEHETNSSSAGSASSSDFIDAYLAQIRATVDLNSSFYGDEGKKSLFAVLGITHGANFGTPTTTLLWAILYLIKNPEMQEKLQNEIDTVIGHNRSPCLEDMSKMVYTQALLMETLRISSLAPSGINHVAMSDTEFETYKIPKGTNVILNLYSALNDVHTWKDPKSFNPERFVSPDGTSIINQDNLAFVPFSGGARTCLGKPLALKLLFLYLTSIFQKFSLSVDSNAPNPSTEAVFGIINAPKAFNIEVKERV